MKETERIASDEPSAKRSEFLFCYDVRMANPNGDPDENRPRIDPVTGRNLVTEFRLKRTIRDYLKDSLCKDSACDKIFMRVEENEQHQLKTVEDLATSYITKEDKEKKIPPSIDREKLVSEHIDVRLFGLLFAVEKMHFKQVGPIQFAIGKSLNKVDELTIRMTRVVPTREEAKAGTFGEKSVLRYSFIVFHGFLNDFVAKQVKLSEDDVSKMMKAMWYGTDELSTTSKFGQRSKLLIRVNYSNPLTYIGDLDRYLTLEKANDKVDMNKLEDVSQTRLNVQRLFDILKENKKKIDSIEYASSKTLVCFDGTQAGTFSSLLNIWAAKEKVEIKNILQEQNENC
jgi:CRISPR-associated protein Csh2